MPALLVSLMALVILTAGCDSNNPSPTQIEPKTPSPSNTTQETNSDSSIDQTFNRPNPNSELISPEDNLPEPKSNLRFRTLETGPDFAYKNGEEA
ncbi:MAG: hypothetical protein CMJ55_03600, partial [Planctomycetaceae bacterium]|nr:hypothetical protein [Planctomycetaceae bacterium]